MVNERQDRLDKELGEGPPPFDEAWWESVLAEEEANHHAFFARYPLPSAPSDKITTRRTSSVPTPVDWEHALELYKKDKTIDLQVTGFNRGGLLVNGEKLQGFVPISHLVDMPRNKTPTKQVEYLSTYVDRSLQLKVIECDQERGRVVFSERAALVESGRRNQLLHQLKPGECVMGTVTNVTDFGVFVDLGGVEGLIHVSEISWGRVRHPNDVVKVNDRKRVYVINVDQERSRVALSLKRLCQNPWETAESRYSPGEIREAIITSIVPFGAFARLEEGLDGLIHISEMHQAGETFHMLDGLSEGQQVQVRVLHVDASKQRLGLSLLL